MDELFTPSGDWQRLPAVAALAERLNSLVVNLIAWAVIVVAVWFLTHGLLWAVGVAAVSGLCWTLWRVIRIGRWVRSFGFSEGERDLTISHGLWFKTLTSIPYGRMLSVEVTTNPITRLWGLAAVQLVTASHNSNARIPALSANDAARLRDDLIARGEEQALPL